MTHNNRMPAFAYHGLTTEADEREALAYCTHPDPATIRERLYRAVTASLRDDLKREFVRRLIDDMAWEDVSYWVLRVGTTRGRRAFKILFRVAERV